MGVELRITNITIADVPEELRQLKRKEFDSIYAKVVKRRIKREQSENKNSLSRKEVI
ncbi:hypothetical protein BX659_1252 [Orenia metallireducens]|uniref:Uncharacterized protein n=1 Tax=Orenia metallireducens TaxID=1413210 RepID=A0A285HSB1_9FIRM|nr:hypothetical protein [Orenia metallireducens]PRX24039.1 hypothetical protein BX659_1252 [Orenia metallireducens]SNY38612.1 hypothetical protein SAMN06265827_1243 [Orenia metallireducens]